MTVSLRQTIEIRSHLIFEESQVLHVIEKFDFLRGLVLQSPVLTHYVDIRFFAYEGMKVGIEVIERIDDRHVDREGTSSELLIRYLLAVREIQSMGIGLPNRRADDAEIWTHWAHAWLLSSSHATQITDVIPSQLLSSVPADLLSVTHSRDLLGFLAVSGLSLEAPREAEPRPPQFAGSITEAVRLLKVGKVSSADRLSIYEKILGTDELESPDIDLDPCFLRRFGDIVFNGNACGRVSRNLATKFFNRVVLHDFTETFFKLIRLVDKPLADALTEDHMEPIWRSVLACTLRDDDLIRLWDLSLVSPPEFLVRVVMFAIVDLRDLVIQGDGADAILTMGDLVQDFYSIIELAIANDGLA